MAPGITMMDYGRGTIKARDFQKCAANVPSTPPQWLSPISLCLYRIRSFIVVGHKLFYVPFKDATIDFIIIVNTLFVDRDELTLATFLP